MEPREPMPRTSTEVPHETLLVYLSSPEAFPFYSLRGTEYSIRTTRTQFLPFCLS